MILDESIIPHKHKTLVEMLQTRKGNYVFHLYIHFLGLLQLFYLSFIIVSKAFRIISF